MISISGRDALDRRALLKLVLFLTGYTLSGCARIFPNPDSGDCSAQTAGRLTIDMHCHLMNLRDVHRESFVNRRIVDGEETFPEYGALSSFATWVVSLPGYLFTKSASSEYQWISKETELLQKGAQQFCDIAAKEQAGLFFPKDDKQTTGFFSNRTRLAARMMEIYPEVDLFTPSMVDFYEGDWEKYSYPTELVNYYKQLHIASNGRFLPLVSFSPERYYEEEIVAGWEESEHYKRNLKLVKYAIEELGFVGVKLHPSSGFSPIDNAKYGCPNTPGQKQKKLSPCQAEQYDKILMELFEYCRSVDVPLLIHSGSGIPANRTCMESKTSPEKWTNSPYSWSQALDVVNRENLMYEGTLVPDDQKLRICFAHFAGAFCNAGKKLKEVGKACIGKGHEHPHPWLVQAAHAAVRHKGVYVDLADVTEWFDELSSDDKECACKTSSDDTKCSCNSSPADFKKSFHSFLSENSILSQRIMYGTDWHMPSVAKIGGKYNDLIEDFLPEEIIDITMGLNAVEFYGLAKGRATRRRLETFYTRHSLNLDNIRWISKVDQYFNSSGISQ